MDNSQKTQETPLKHATKPETSKEPSSGAPTEKPLKTPENDASAKIAELTNDLQRTRADFENYRKNVEKDKENLRKLTKFAEVSKFLPLLDDLDRAISVYSELKPLEKNFQKSLKSLNLEKINTKKGSEFDPAFHEAVMTERGGK